ncbi:hypothetical protein ABEB36_015294 [Hypothenemus hampei]|uniref:Uncharacterized protein n=1 Tax=Hypothenemus hampei TaxID=57062 RepID=A0ABD1E2H3_HYPHA
MLENFYRKDASNMKIKLKNLKTEYLKVKKSNSVSGADRKTCKFYDLLHELLRNRPTAVMEGIDSSQIISNQQTELDNSTIVVEDIDTNMSDEISFDTNNFTEIIEYEGENDSTLTSTSTSASTSNATPKHYKSRSRRSTTTVSAIQEIKQSIEESLRLLKGQAEVLKNVTEQFTVSLSALLKECKNKH